MQDCLGGYGAAYKGSDTGADWRRTDRVNPPESGCKTISLDILSLYV